MRTLLGLTLSWTLFLPLLFSEVRQAHVDPRTITLPVVDGKGIRFTRLSTDEGLSQTKLTHIVQDDQGFMWFGTQYGLNRYDGYNFKLFVHDPRNPNSLSGVYVKRPLQGSRWRALGRTRPISQSFNGTFRAECLNAHWFGTLAEAKRLIEAWRQEYNESRPHSSLDDRTPGEFASQYAASRVLAET